MADQDKTEVQYVEGFDIATPDSKLGEVRVEAESEGTNHDAKSDAGALETKTQESNVGDTTHHDSSDVAVLGTNVEEVRVAEAQHCAPSLTSLAHVYVHLQSDANQGDSSDAAAVEEVKGEGTNRNNDSDVAALELGMGELKVDHTKKKARTKRSKAPKKERRATKHARIKLTKAEKKEEERLVKKVIAHFKTRYPQDNLACWQAISHDLGVKIGVTIAECKQFLKVVFINIFDFVDACKQNELPKYFDSADQLSDYIEETGMYFPLDRAKANRILKWMLIVVGRTGLASQI